MNVSMKLYPPRYIKIKNDNTQEIKYHVRYVVE